MAFVDSSVFQPVLPAWQSAQALAQKTAQQWVLPASQAATTLWQQGLPPAENQTMLERLKTNYVKNQAVELALKAEIARWAGFLQVAAEYERQRQGVLAQLQQNPTSVAWNTVAPDPTIGFQNQWQLAKVAGSDLWAKGSTLGQVVLGPRRSVGSGEVGETALTPTSGVGTVVSP